MPDVWADGAGGAALMAAPRKKVGCRHCRKRKRCRPRGLCFVCHSDAEIRDLYPAGSAAGKNAKYARRAEADGYRAGPLPAAPTDAPPGSEEKMRVMRARVRAGEQLHHPGDRKDPDAGRLRPFLGDDRYRGEGDPLAA
jgi:hypothetical protein